jgi:hypothetical protein
MTKHGGRYYLQYGAPGTEHNVYATGAYVGDRPLGPFTYAPYNPVAYKPGGFVTGAGHGNTFQDAHGNWWMTGTPWVAFNWNFERRVALLPAAFDADGQLHASARFADFPHRAPRGRWGRPEELFAGWMLLSYRKRAAASTARDSFPAPTRPTRTRARSGWPRQPPRARRSPSTCGRGHRARGAGELRDYRSGLSHRLRLPTRFRLLASPTAGRGRPVADLSRETRDRPNAYLELAAPTRARFVATSTGAVARAPRP